QRWYSYWPNLPGVYQRLSPPPSRTPNINAVSVMSAQTVGSQRRNSTAVAAGALDVLVLFIIAALLVTVGSLVVLISSDFEKVEPSGTALNTFWGCVG